MAKRALASQGIDGAGLSETDRKILKILVAAGRPIGLRTLADLVGENLKTLLEVYEPYLLRQGFLRRTQFGRVATEEARSLFL
jgi:Holliday junction DNA helicase RuvB